MEPGSGRSPNDGNGYPLQYPRQRINKNNNRESRPPRKKVVFQLKISNSKGASHQRAAENTPGLNNAKGVGINVASQKNSQEASMAKGWWAAGRRLVGREAGGSAEAGSQEQGSESFWPRRSVLRQ